MMHVQLDVPLATRTTLGVGGNTHLLCEPSVAAVPQAVRLGRLLGKKIFVIGSGSNVLVSDRGLDGVVIAMAPIFSRSLVSRLTQWNGQPEQVVEIPAGTVWDTFVEACVANDLQGVECLSGIPGTVGAAPVQNIGAYGQQVSETIEWVRVMDLEHVREVVFSRDACTFGYRRSTFSGCDRYLITAVAFRLRHNADPCIAHPQVSAAVRTRSGSLADVRAAVLKIRQGKGMLEGQYRSAGSFFKNPEMSERELERRFAADHIDSGANRWWWPVADGIRISAGWLIQVSGFPPGYRRGSVGLSPHHALCIINLGGASASDVVALARDIQNRVNDCFGIILEPEVRLLGFDKYPLLTA